MKRPLRPEEVRLWSLVTATVRPAHGRGAVPASADAAPEPAAPLPPPTAPLKPPPQFQGPPKPNGPPPRAKAPRPPEPPPPPPPPGRIEPNRQRRLVRERDPLDRRIDLHGLDQDRARAMLIGFLLRAQEDGVRAVLVITGKGGLRSDGVLRRRTPEWLAEPVLRGVVAGLSPADRRHGGEGALYVALRRRG